MQNNPNGVPKEGGTTGGPHDAALTHQDGAGAGQDREDRRTPWPALLRRRPMDCQGRQMGLAISGSEGCRRDWALCEQTGVQKSNFQDR